MPIRNRLAELHPEITKWRRHLHESPELMYDVHETAAFVVERLTEMGVDEITPGIGKTGVVAVIKGKTDTSGCAPIWMRCQFPSNRGWTMPPKTQV